MGYGYACKRSSSRTNIIKAYGKWTIPQYCSGVYSSTNTNNNIVPEMFFGFYNQAGSVGFDLGILYAGNGMWKAFYYGTDNVWNDTPTFSLTPNETIYVNGWVSKDSSGRYYANLNLSRSGYDLYDIYQFRQEITNDSIKNYCDIGFRINREISMAVNNGAANTYENTNTYIYNAGFSQHTLIAVTGAYWTWSDTESLNIESQAPWRYACEYVDGLGKSSVLELRKDEGPVNSRYISATCDNPSTGATDCGSIHFGNS